MSVKNIEQHSMPEMLINMPLKKQYKEKNTISTNFEPIKDSIINIQVFL